MEEGLKEHCATCDVAAECRKAFGRYWREKSRGGVGCTCRFPARSVQATPERRRRPEPWEIAHKSTGRAAGLLCTHKRHGMARQGTML